MIHAQHTWRVPFSDCVISDANHIATVICQQQPETYSSRLESKLAMTLPICV